jgi:GT2 family glycosyltransferase
MKASIIIPNFNGEKLLEKNLPVVLVAAEYGPNEIKEIIIVDDGSWDRSVEFVKEKFPQVKLIKHTKNRGFSAAVNTGARMSKGDLLVLLNSDVVPSKDFLISTQKLFVDTDIFGISLHEKGYTWAKGFFQDGFIQIGPGKKTLKPHLSFWVSGGSGVFSRDKWMKLGGMDEKLLSPFYWEDIDLCFRAAKRGWKILWDPDAHVEHKHESTISKLPRKYVERIRERNQLLFIWKNLLSSSLFRRHIIGVLKRLVRHPGYIIVVFMALGKIGVVLKERRKEKKESKVSDEAIFARFN